MFFNKLAAATAVFALLPQALGALPSYCSVSKVDKYEDTWYDDQSATCQAAGVATHCCSTFVGGGLATCSPSFSSGEVSDLENVLAQQIRKTGQFDVTTVGPWTASYSLFADDQVNPDVLQEFFHTITDYVNEGQSATGPVSDIYFQYYANDVVNQIVVTYNC